MNAKAPYLLLYLLILVIPRVSHSQFMDTFEGDETEGWFFFTGDGEAAMDFVQRDGYARILVDATEDRHNVWWAVIKRDISPSLDLSLLAAPEFELRVEARVRVSDAPRRINFMINTQRTTDFHEHLMEYEIPDATGWHTISMTTRDLNVVPGDSLYVQLGVTDWGPNRYHVDVDHYRADVVSVNGVAPDLGEPLPYHPPIRDPNTFAHHLDVTHDALIHADFPDVNFNDWHIRVQEQEVPVLTVSARQWAVLRWDLGAGGEADGAGLLELTTHSVLRGGDYAGSYGEDLGMEFGKVRVVEILGGDPGWDQKHVTYNSLLAGGTLADVFNSQMIFDTEVTEEPGGKTYVTISRPVLQRLLDGRTKGILIRPLGALNATFYASEHQLDDYRPKLLFNTKP